MGLTQQEEKYINLSLANLYEKALTYEKLAKENTSSKRDKAIWKALAEETRRIFNFSLRTLGTVATSKLGLKQELIISTLQKGSAINGASVDELSPAEIREIVNLTFGLDQEERDKARIKINRELTQLSLVTVNADRRTKEAIEYLHKTGALAELIRVDRIAAGKDVPELDLLKPLPRGDARKGGLVNKYLQQGKLHSEAIRLAEIEMGLESEEEIIDIDITAKPEGAKMSIAEAIKLQQDQSNSQPQSIADIFGLTPVSQEEALKIMNDTAKNKHADDEFFTEDELEEMEK